MDLKRVHGKAEDFIEKLQQIHKVTEQKLLETTTKYKYKADKKHFVEFQEGDFVYVVLTRINFLQASKTSWHPGR